MINYQTLRRISMYCYTTIAIVVFVFQLYEAKISSDCEKNICLSLYEGKENQFVLLCVVPNLYRQIIFLSPNNTEYAHCILPFPSSLCYTQNSDSSIVQDLKANQTILIIKHSDTTDLTGRWFCSHGSDGDKESIDVVITKRTTDSKCTNCRVFLVLTVCACCCCIVTIICTLIIVRKKILQGKHSLMRRIRNRTKENEKECLCDTDFTKNSAAKHNEMKCKCCPDNHPLVPQINPIVPTTLSKNQNHSDVLRKKYTIAVSNEKCVTRIRGIAYLKSGGLFALADYKNKKLKVFSKYKLVFEKYLNMEPRGMTGISGNKIAVTFAYEKKIIFYEVAKLDASKCDEFNLKQIGKPFEIAYHKDHFIVELNEGIDGCIVILDDYCNKIYEIQNEDSQFGYFTGNTIRLQLDMDREEFYVAAIGRKAVYCLDFYGAVKWLVKVPSPRGIAIVPNTKDTTLLFASHKSSAIYKLICKEQNGSERYKLELIEMEAEDETTLEEDKIKLPEYISYDYDNCLLYTEVANGNVSVYHLEKQTKNEILYSNKC